MLTDDLVRIVCLITMGVNFLLFMVVVIRLIKVTRTSKYDDIITSIIKTTKELNEVDKSLTKLSEDNYLTLAGLISTLYRAKVITGDDQEFLIKTLNGQSEDVCKDIKH